MIRHRLTTAIVLLLAISMAAAEEPFSGTIQLVARDAIAQGKAKRHHAIIEGEVIGGRWDRLYCTNLSLNNGDSYGFIQEAKVDAQEFNIKMMLVVGKDPWISGGEGTYELSLKRLPEGRVEGTHRGTFNGEEVSGKVEGTVGPPRPVRIANYKPLDPTERPRLMFRKHDLPALRQKLQTPFGQAYLAAAKASAEKQDLVSLGMLYQLTGEKVYAQQAQRVIESRNHDLAGETGAGSGGMGHQLVAVALAYDLCYEAFEQGFRAELTNDFDREVAFLQRTLNMAGGNFHPCSNFYGPGRGAPAIASLALFGEKGPAPRKPVSPDEIAAGNDLRAKMMAKSGRLEKYRAEYPSLVARWQADHLAWERTGGADLGKLEFFHAGYLHANRHYRWGIGDGGYGSETGVYADIAAYYPLIYNTYYMNMFGREATLRPDVSLLPVRRMMQTIFLPGGKIATQTIGPVGGWQRAFVAAGFPFIPERFKPAVLWGWNQINGVKEDDASTISRLFDARWTGTNGMELAHCFLHYPLDMKPVHPQQIMPKNWEAAGFGWYAFRNGWDKGSEEILAQVFLKAKPIGGWNLPNAGTFRLMGLGHVWAIGNHSKEAYRFEENVLMLPEDAVNDRANAHRMLVDFQDGSGALTMDMNDLYGSTREVEKVIRKVESPSGITIKKTKGDEENPEMVHTKLYDRNGLRQPEHWVDSGVKGLRAFGFDYSGKSGAPLLMVIVDKVDGGKARDWSWQIPGDSGEHGRKIAPKSTADDKSFTFDYGDASLRATFVSPEKVKIDPDCKVHIDYKRWQGRMVEYDRVSVTSPSGHYFVVVTLQRKDAPAVKVEGSGLDAKVTVGGQTVRFDGTRVVFGS